MFQGKLLKIGVAEQYEVMEFLRDANNSIVGYRGTVAETTKWLARRLNFTYVFVPVEVKKYAIKQNGTWDSHLALLQNREVDYVFIATAMDRERAEDFEMAGMLAEEGGSFLFAAPKAESRLQSLVSPFDFMVWLTFLAVMVVIPLILHGLLRAAGRLPIHHDAGIMPLSKWLFYVFAVVLNQGGNIHWKASRHNAVRITLAVFLLSTIIFSNAYLSGYISCNTFPKMKKNPTTFEEAAVRSDLRIAMLKRDNIRFFTESPVPSIQKISQEWLLNGRPGWEFSFYHEAINMISSGRYYLVTVQPVINNITTVDEKQTGQCRFERGKIPVMWTYFSFLTWKGNKDAEMFRLELMRLRETGLTAVWRKQMYNYGKRCLNNYKDTNRPPIQRLALRDTQGPFIMLGVGCSLAILFFLFTLCQQNKKAPCMKKHTQSTRA